MTHPSTRFLWQCSSESVHGILFRMENPLTSSWVTEQIHHMNLKCETEHWLCSQSWSQWLCSHCALLRHRCMLQLCPTWRPCWLYGYNIRSSCTIGKCLIPKFCQLFNYGRFFIEVYVADWGAVACSVIRQSKMSPPCAGNLKYIGVQA